MAEIFDMICHENCMGCKYEKYKTAKGRSKCPTIKMRKKIVNRTIYQMRKAAKQKAINNNIK